MRELKNCQFCESNDIDILTYEEEYHTRKVAECMNCGARGSVCDSKEEAIEAWNTRPAEDALKAELERLKAEVTRYRRALHNLKEDCQKRLHWKNSSLAKLFLHEVITHIDAELDYAPDTGKMEKK